MAAREIVGAVINSDQVTNDMAVILRSASAGQQVDYISRKRAETIASFRGGDAYRRLARSATLFIVDGGIRFVPPDLRTGVG